MNSYWEVLRWETDAYTWAESKLRLGTWTFHLGFQSSNLILQLAVTPALLQEPFAEPR
jgi:hypothetical protein